MSMELTLYIIALGLAIVATLSLAVVGFLRRRVPGAGPFLGLVLASAVYAFGTIFEIQGNSSQEVAFWLSIEYLGIATIGPFWLMLTSSFGGRSSKRLPPWMPMSLVLPLVIIVAVFTNDSHQLFYSSVGIEKHGPFTVSILGKGPLYWLNMAYVNLCILGGTVATFRFMFQSHGVYRRQAVVLAMGCLVPWLGMALYQAGLSPWGLDVAPFGMAVSGVLFAVGFFRYQLLDLSPVVHQNVFEGMGDGVLVVDTKLRVLAANPALATIFPDFKSGLVGVDSRIPLHSRPELLYLLSGAHAEALDLDVEVEGARRSYEVASSPMNDRRGRRLGTILTLRDISARTSLMAKVELMAVTDELTGVPNRRHFMEVGQREIERARRYGLPLAVAIMDLDHFKNVNDRWGHEAGDAVLAQAARVCAKGLRSTDLFARYGGEEFVMLLYDSPASHSTLSVERLRKSLENMVVAWERDGSSQGIRVTGSFGLTWREPMGDDDLATLLREADDAMYRAKETGRNRLVAFDAASMRLEDREDREDPGLPGGT